MTERNTEEKRGHKHL